MRILYFGDPQCALTLLRKGMHVVGLIHGRVGGPKWRTLFDHIRQNELSIYRAVRPNLNDSVTVNDLARLKPTLIVSCFYPDLIPPSILALAPGINVHPSDLPQWRGPDPIVHTILSGQSKSAVCIHALTEGLDEGDIYERREVEINNSDTAGTLSLRLEQLGADMMSAFVCESESRLNTVPLPQQGQVSWAPQYADEWWEIDWSRSAIEIERFIRASNPFPGAFTGIGEELLIVISAVAESADGFESLVPGTPFLRNSLCLIRCGQGALRLKQVRLGKRKLSGESFARLLC